MFRFNTLNIYIKSLSFSHVCVLGGGTDLAFISTIFILIFGTALVVWYFCISIIMLTLQITEKIKYMGSLDETMYVTQEM